MIVWYLDLQLPVQSAPNTTNVASSNPTQAIQHYVIKFVSDLSLTSKTDRHNINDILSNRLHLTCQELKLYYVSLLGTDHLT